MRFSASSIRVMQYASVKMTDFNKTPILNPLTRKPVWTREYQFTRADGTKVIIQDHSAGHVFGQGGIGDQGAHFNGRPFENTRTGKVIGTREYYSY